MLKALQGEVAVPSTEMRLSCHMQPRPTKPKPFLQVMGFKQGIERNQRFSSPTSATEGIGGAL